MMKKLFALILALVTVLSLCACGSNPPVQEDTNGSNVSEEISGDGMSTPSEEDAKPSYEEREVLVAYFAILTALDVKSNINESVSAETSKGEDNYYINIERPAQHFYEQLNALDQSVIEKWKDTPYTAADQWNDVVIDWDYDAVMSRFSQVDNVLLERRFSYMDNLGNVDAPRVRELFSYDKYGNEIVDCKVYSAGGEGQQMQDIFDLYDTTLRDPLNYYGWDYGYKREYATDEDGKITQIKYIDEHSEDVEFLVTPTYDNEGNRTSDLVISKYWENTVNYFYDDSGRLIRVDHTEPNNGFTFSTNYTYSGDKIVKIATTAPNYPISETVEFTYDNSGKLASAEYTYTDTASYSADRQALYTFTYDDQGRILTADITRSGYSDIYPKAVMENIYGTCYVYTPVE